MAKSLFVGNIPYQISEAELEEMFSQAGAVESVTVMRDRMTGRPRGFAFVSMANDEDAQKAVQQFDGTQLGGRAIAVNEARPRPERGPGDFGGGGGGFGGGGGRPGGGGGRRPGGGGGGRGGGGGGYGGGGGGGGRREPRW
ncbi:MAG TPA: RNA-binding protein [Luteitalea sp.]|nr:RNA-binding protein [Luteitalea sp.]